MRLAADLEAKPAGMKNGFLWAIGSAIAIIVPSTIWLIVHIPQAGSAPSSAAAENISFSLDDGEGVVRAFPKTTAPGGSTVLHITKTLLAGETLFLETAPSAETGGVTVVQIGEKKNGSNNRSWQYWVNGIAPRTGADHYIVRSNDHIEWRFTKTSMPEEKPKTATVKIAYGDNNSKTFEHLPVGENDYAYDLLKKALEPEKTRLVLQYSDYVSDTGGGSYAYVEQIGGVRNDGIANSFWTSYINGFVSSDEATSKYIVQPGDVLEWKFEIRLTR